MGKMSDVEFQIHATHDLEFEENGTSVDWHKLQVLANNSLIEVIDEADSRQESKVVYRLSDIVLITVIAVCANQLSFVAISEFVEMEKDWFAKYTHLQGNVPSPDTIRRLLNCVNPELLQSMFQAAIQRLASTSSGSQIAIDGKSVKGTYASESNRILHSVSLYQTDLGLCLGQLTTTKEDGKEQGELQVIPQLLDMLDCRAKVFTIDAGGCYRPIVDKIVEKRADYVITLKSNQPKLVDYAKSLFVEEAEMDDFVTQNKGHGRLETRCYSIRSVPPDSVFAHEWRGLKSVVKVVSTRKIKDQTEEFTRYFITSLPSDQLRKIANAIRSHWGIENQLHWSLDVTFNEDKQRTHKGWNAENLVILRRAAVSFLRGVDRKMSLTKAILHVQLDRKFRSKIAELLFPPNDLAEVEN